MPSDRLVLFIVHRWKSILKPLSYFPFSLHQLFSFIPIHSSLHSTMSPDQCVASSFCVLPTTLRLILPPRHQRNSLHLFLNYLTGYDFVIITFHFFKYYSS